MGLVGRRPTRVGYAAGRPKCILLSWVFLKLYAIYLTPGQSNKVTVFGCFE